jgi:hypothetical protein
MRSWDLGWSSKLTGGVIYENLRRDGARHHGHTSALHLRRRATDFDVLAPTPEFFA